MDHSLYRLALDIGTNSLGWCMFTLDTELRPCDIFTMGVRIFSDGRTPGIDKASLAVERRLARQARRRRDRLLGRKNALMVALIQCGLMPNTVHERKTLELRDPYALRAKGLDHVLELHELGRVLLHINQRRGFKSNRKTDKHDENGKIASGIQRLHTTLGQENARTLGEYLYQCKQQGNPTRVRPEGSGNKLFYPLYPERALLEQEFDILWQAQSTFHTQLTPEMGAHIRHIIFHQRPLQPVLPGRCSLRPQDLRAPLALPLVQKFRILQSLNHLHIVSAELQERPLTLQERNQLLVLLLQGENLSFTKIRKELQLDATYTFNLENADDSQLKGCAITKVLIGKKNALLFGTRWFDLSFAEKNTIVERLLDEEDADVLQAELIDTWQLTPEMAEQVANASLPDGYAAHCRHVLEKLCAIMEQEVISYSEAREKAGYSYTDETGELQSYLPYYGCVLKRYVGKTGNATDPLEKRYGRIANPTVHIALNQVRRLVNELIKEHGLPTQVVIEVARDLKNGLKAKQEIQKRQAEERKKNDTRRTVLQDNGIKVTAESLLRMRLWEELAEDAAARCCLYTGEPISFARLFSPEVEIEHILPFARTLDNSPANKTVALRRANRDKGNKSPFEAFAHNDTAWAGILERVNGLSKEVKAKKAWRFAQDAMKRFEQEEGFLDRQLSDTQYIARVSMEYLCAVCPRKEVWVTPGKLTSNLAAAWQFPPKDRNCHTHHARDAALIGVTDKRLLQQAATHYARNQQTGLNRLLDGLPPPWPHFTPHVLAAMEKLVVSHKADHGIAGELHDATAYGILAPEGPRNAQHRKPIAKFTAPAHLLEIKEIKLRAELLRDITGKTREECLEKLTKISPMPEKVGGKAIKDFINCDDKVFAAKFLQAATAKGIRAIRVVESKSLIPIKNKDGVVYKGLSSSSNAWYDIYETPKGKWVHDVVTTFEANTYAAKNNGALLPAKQEKGRHVMRLFKNDMLELEEAGKKKYCYVLKMTVNGQIVLVEHQEANPDKRARDKKDPFSLSNPMSSNMQKNNAKAVFVTPAGKIIYKERPCHVAARCGNKRE